MYSSKGFNYYYMGFFVYETCEKLIWTSDEGCRNKNIIIKQGIPKRNMNMISPSETLGIGCYLHKDTCGILSEMLVSKILQAYSSIN